MAVDAGRREQRPRGARGAPQEASSQAPGPLPREVAIRSLPLIAALAVLTFPASAHPHTEAAYNSTPAYFTERPDPVTRPNCQRRYRLGLTRFILNRAFSPKRWRDKTPLRKHEVRRLVHMRRCAKTPWHAKRMRELRRAAAERHRERRRRLLRAIRQRRCGSPECNLRLGLHIASRHGIDAAQRSCMVELWTRESGWREWIWNTSGSGAYGIPQALPASKLPPRGQPSAPNGWRKAKAQIRWGISYVVERYQTFCGALSFWLRNRWY